MPEPAAKTDRARLARPSCSNVVVCLALGAATTGMLAWAISLALQLGWLEVVMPRPRLVVQSQSDQSWMMQSNWGHRVDVEDDLDWPIDVPDDWPAPRFGAEGWGPGVRGRSAWFEHYSGGGRIMSNSPLPYYSAGYSRAGLPLTAVSSEHAFRETPPQVDLGVLRNGVLVHRDAFGRERRLPLLIHWPAFLIDTLFWGAAWLGFIAAFRSLRARRRRKRGLCVACKYELAGLGLCPECGARSEPSLRSDSAS